MGPGSQIVAHHSEAVDPTLVEWIRHQIDKIVGLEPGAMVALLGALIVLFPFTLLFMVWCRRRNVGKSNF